MVSCADTCSEPGADVAATPPAPGPLLVPGWRWTDLLGPTLDVRRQLSYSVLLALGWGALGQDWRIVLGPWCASILLHLLVEPVIVLNERGIGTFTRSRAQRGPLSSGKANSQCTLIAWRDVQRWRRQRWRGRAAIVLHTRTGSFVMVPAGNSAAARAYLDDIESELRKRTVLGPALSR